MMDGLRRESPPAALERCRRILMLCGSRMPEAGNNFRRLLAAARPLETSSTPVALLAAVGSQPPLEVLERLLQQGGYRRSLPPSDELGAAACWVRGPAGADRAALLRSLGGLGGSLLDNSRHGNECS